MHISQWLWALVALILFGAAVVVARQSAAGLGAKLQAGFLVGLSLPFVGAMYKACQGIGESHVPAQALWLLTVMAGAFVAAYYARTPRTAPFFIYTGVFTLAAVVMFKSFLDATAPWGNVQVVALGAY